MRNGLLLAVGVLTLALLPAIGHTSAPTFVDVPGVITLNVDNGTTYSAVDVFTYDSAVLDPDSVEADLVWTFVEDATGLTVVPMPSGGIFETVEGVGAVASKGAARTATTSDSINAGATAFSLVVTTGTLGQSTAAVAMGAGTVAEATVNDDLYTTIVIAVRDEANNVAYQTVIVKADYSATGGANAGGLYETVMSGNVASYTYTDQWGNGVASNGGNAGGVMTMTANNPAYDFLTGQGLWGYAYYISPVFQVEPGYVYRASADVATSGDTDTFNGFRMRIQEVNFKANGEFELKTTFAGGDGKFPTTTAQQYEVLYEPPQNSRFDGVLYNADYKLYLDYQPLFASQSGVDVDFSNVVVDRFAIPSDEDEHGLLYFAETLDQWETVRNADGTTVSAPIGFPGDGSRGIKLVPRANAEFTVDTDTFYQASTNHTDYSQAIGSGTTNVGDSITTVVVSGAVSAGEIEVRSNKAANNGYTGTFSEIVTGEQGGVAGPTNTNASWIPASIVTSLLDKVYYRASVRVKAGTGDAVLDAPQLYIRQGTPGANYNCNFSYNEYGGAGASPTEWTWYTTWTKGYHDATAVGGTNTYYNSWTLKIQVLDTNALGFATNIGGSTFFDTLKLELYPVARFAD